jgi:hypothetical protein
MGPSAVLRVSSFGVRRHVTAQRDSIIAIERSVTEQEA